MLRGEVPGNKGTCLKEKFPVIKEHVKGICLREKFPVIKKHV